MSRKISYGIDAPMVPIGYFIVSLIIIPSAYFMTRGAHWASWSFGYGIIAFILGTIYMHTTLRGKFRMWEDIFEKLLIQPDAKILDLGCGRGAVLIMAAKKTGDHGKAVGVDLWRSVDQSGNDINRTKQNAELGGVIDKIELKTADITNLPFENNSFDYVTSSLAIHNIKGKDKRRKAIMEACRVLKNGGSLIIADMSKAKEYAPILHSIKMKNIDTKNAGWQGWWTGPWLPTKIVTASK